MRSASPSLARLHRVFIVRAFTALLPALGSGGCSPQTAAVDGGAEDFSQTTRDLTSCGPLPGNLLGNPGFEQPSLSAVDGNGQATNRGNPASTIPGGPLGPWDGCCDQGAGAGGTTWAVRTTMPLCGTRAVSVVSDRAAANVLSQRLDLAASSGQSFRVSAWVFIGQAPAGAQLGLDVFDLMASHVLASSPVLTATTADWHYLSLMGQVPTGGALQVRINSSGTLSAVVDDVAVVLQ